MPNTTHAREALLERTLALYWRHLPLWMGVLVSVAATAAGVYWLVSAAVSGLLPPEAPPPVGAAARAMPRLAAAAWVIAGMVGAQTVALRASADRAGPGDPATADLPSLGSVLAGLAPRFLGALASTVLVLVHVAALGAVGIGAAAGLAWLPLALLPRLGASEATARSIALLVLLPLLLAGVVPAVWWLGRHVLAIAFQTLDGGSAWMSLRTARAATRGHAGSVLGLLVVTLVGSNVFVLLCRAAGSLATLLVAPERFRPIFGEGPLQSSAGAGVQLGATLAATFVTLPLMLMPLAVLSQWLRARGEAAGEGHGRDRPAGGRLDAARSSRHR